MAVRPKIRRPRTVGQPGPLMEMMLKGVYLTRWFSLRGKLAPNVYSGLRQAVRRAARKPTQGRTIIRMLLLVVVVLVVMTSSSSIGSLRTRILSDVWGR